MPETASRVMRVFISSTFRAMGAEREALVKFVFPQLRKRCEERGVTWGEVDLRWGITDEQAAEGQVLPICLAEIERSRPYFLGLLGKRYGWVPGEIPPDLIEQEPWLADHLDHSVTELEILHAFFYLRDPVYLQGVTEAERSDCAEDDPTLAVLHVLARDYADRRDEWALLAGKAEGWLQDARAAGPAGHASLEAWIAGVVAKA